MAAARRGDVRVGISGWTYVPWRGVFYPQGLRHRDELAYAAARLTSIEVNGSFYALQRPASWAAWRDATPDGFVLAVKGPRFVTHLKRLRDVREPLANFFASGVLGLGATLGPILWQLPPNLAYDPDVLDAFLALLPRDTTAAAALAAERDAERMRDRELLTAAADRPVRHALEPRSHTFADPAVRDGLLDRLRAAGVALVLGDSAGRWPRLDEVTADFVYARLHGDTELYASGYDDAALDRWATWVRGHRDAGRDVHVYFDNDLKVRSPVDAMALLDRLRT